MYIHTRERESCISKVASNSIKLYKAVSIESFGQTHTSRECVIKSRNWDYSAGPRSDYAPRGSSTTSPHTATVVVAYSMSQTDEDVHLSSRLCACVYVYVGIRVNRRESVLSLSATSWDLVCLSLSLCARDSSIALELGQSDIDACDHR